MLRTRLVQLIPGFTFTLLAGVCVMFQAHGLVTAMATVMGFLLFAAAMDD